MFKRPSGPPPPSAPALDPPQRADGVLCFSSRAQLVAWHDALHNPSRSLREVDPLHRGDVSAALALLAEKPHGGTLLLLTPKGSRALRWLDDARIEHGPDAIDGPYRMRLEDKAGVLVGVTPSAPPVFWDDLEPDAWPVPEAVEARFDERRVRAWLNVGPFAAPVGVSSRDHEAESLLAAGARRWFRGVQVPTIAGLVAFGDHPEQHLPGCAVAIRRAGWSDQLLRGSLSWLAERVAEERSLWGPVPPVVARAVVMLALAERAWAGPEAATPITLSMEADRLRLAVPTRAANRREREDRAPGNPRLRNMLVRSGSLPTAPDIDIPDNDEVLAQIAGRWPGVRSTFRREGTWIEVPLRAGEGSPRLVSTQTLVVAARPGAPVSAPESQVWMASLTSESAVDAAPGTRAGATFLEPAASMSTGETPQRPAPRSVGLTSDMPAVAPSAPSPRAPRPRSGPAPIFHPRPPAPPEAGRLSKLPLTKPSPDGLGSAPAGHPKAADRPLPAQQPAVAPATRTVAPPDRPAPPPLIPSPTPTVPAAGPMSLDERKAQLQALFRSSEHPLGMRALATALGLHRDTLRPAINALITEGWLEPTDDNPRSPVLRYRRLGA